MRLTLVRHAKSSWRDAGQDDYDRPLNGRGRRDGPRMADWMHGHRVQPDWVLISGARRTRETADALLPALGIEPLRWHFDDRLYHASADMLLNVVRETPMDVQWLMLIGHNPGITDFANLLAGRLVNADMPTLATITFALQFAAWTELRFADTPSDRVRLELHMSPKGLPGSDDDGD